ncbi:MAG: DUF421 domain-containing protein [Bacilli bacterium]
MDDFIQVCVRAILSLIALFLVTKMIGKKQVSQLSLFDYVIGISIGNFAAEMTINLDSQISHGIIAVIIFGLIAYFISIATMKNMKLRRFFAGVPTILIKDGILIEKGLKKVKFDINDFLEQCREQGYFDISEIAYAIMEASGKVSILPKNEYKTVVNKDMNIKKPKASLCANVIIDGKVMNKNLHVIGKDEKWLAKKLKEKGKKQEEILLATLDNQEKLLIYEKSDNVVTGVLE